MTNPAPRPRRATGAPYVAGILVVLAAAFLLWPAHHNHAVIAQTDTVGGPFTLTDDDGRIVSPRSYPGKYLLIYFGYTACPDICPATLSSMAAALDHLGPIARRIQPLFITIDPAHDTAAILRRYVGAFSPDLVGLTGTAPQIDEAMQEYRVVRIPRPGHEKPAMFDHSAVLYLMAPDGHFLAPVSADASSEAMADQIGKLVSR